MSEDAKPSPKPDEILLEVVPFGNALRITAMHPPTLTEVTFQAPPQLTTAELGQLAARKIAYKLRAQAEKDRS